MKLELDKAWYAERIAREGDLEVTVGTPDSERHAEQTVDYLDRHLDDVFAEQHAFGSLIQLLRRDRKLTVEQLAMNARVSTAEIISIEDNPKHVPKPRTVYQLADFFGLPDRALTKLSNMTDVHDSKLRDAAIRFAANSRTVMELTREERQALSEFVKVLGSR